MKKTNLVRRNTRTYKYNIYQILVVSLLNASLRDKIVRPWPEVTQTQLKLIGLGQPKIVLVKTTEFYFKIIRLP